LHEALDQTGATIGPLIVAGVLAAQSSYPLAFATLLIPAVLTMVVLIIARLSFPQPQDLDPAPQSKPATRWIARSFWIYLTATALVAAAYADFPLIAFHFHAAATLPDAWIPTLYSLATASAGLSALAFGRLFDRRGLPILAVSTFVAAFFTPLVFLGGLYAAIAGMLLWGIGLGAHESILRAAIAAMVPAGKRASAYGLFNMVYGIAWFAGSAVLGWLYDTSRSSLVVFSLVLQFAAIPLFLSLHRKTAPVAS
jgi:predicted MFS family arabinose efflux permease